LRNEFNKSSLFDQGEVREAVIKKEIGAVFEKGDVEGAVFETEEDR
jgi:hypothetical protein